MKTQVFTLTKEKTELESILAEMEKAAVYCDLDKKEATRLRLLAEELIGMVPELLDFCSAKFWAESIGKEFELYVSAELNDMFSADREKLLEISKSGKNAAAKGIMGKIRSVVETMFVEYSNAVALQDERFYQMGIAPSHYYYLRQWSLNRYKNAAEENGEEWDELEASIIANLADDVIVGIKGSKVDITVKKKFK